MSYLHKFDSDHEGFLGVWPVQLPGSVANLSETGGQIHSGSAVLGQFPQGHQLGKGNHRKGGSGQADPNLFPQLPSLELSGGSTHYFCGP